MPRSETTACSDLFAVFVFYVFSCACCASTRNDHKPRREIREETRMLWRAEIENGPIPSFMQQPAPPRSISSRGALPSDTASYTPSSYSIPSTPNTDYDESLRLETILSNDKRKDERERTTTVAHSQLPRINPPINEHHPPVVSALPGSRNDTAWMTLPPPTARTIRAMNRVAHTRRSSFSRLSSTGGSSIEMSIRKKGSVRSNATSNSKSSRRTADDRVEKNSVRTQGRSLERRPTGNGSLYGSLDRKNTRPLTPNAVPPQQKQRELQELRQPFVSSAHTQSPPRKNSKTQPPSRHPRPSMDGGLDNTPPSQSIQRPAPAITNPFSPLSVGDFGDDFKIGFADDWRRGSGASTGMM